MSREATFRVRGEIAPMRATVTHEYEGQISFDAGVLPRRSAIVESFLFVHDVDLLDALVQYVFP